MDILNRIKATYVIFPEFIVSNCGVHEVSNLAKEFPKILDYLNKNKMGYYVDRNNVIFLEKCREVVDPSNKRDYHTVRFQTKSKGDIVINIDLRKEDPHVLVFPVLSPTGITSIGTFDDNLYDFLRI